MRCGKIKKLDRSTSPMLLRIRKNIARWRLRTEPRTGGCHQDTMSGTLVKKKHKEKLRKSGKGYVEKADIMMRVGLAGTTTEVDTCTHNSIIESTTFLLLFLRLFFLKSGAPTFLNIYLPVRSSRLVFFWNRSSVKLIVTWRRIFLDTSGLALMGKIGQTSM